MTTLKVVGAPRPTSGRAPASTDRDTLSSAKIAVPLPYQAGTPRDSDKSQINRKQRAEPLSRVTASGDAGAAWRWHQEQPETRVRPAPSHHARHPRLRSLAGSSA